MDYKKYSLEKLQDWVHDSLSTGEASPHEIYSAIREAAREDYYYYKDYASRAYGLLELLSGHRPVADEELGGQIANNKKPLSCDKDDKSPECQSAWNDFWEENYYPEEHKEPKVEDIMPPWGHSDMESLRYTEEELNAMCEKAASDQEKQKCREYNLREAEYYDKRAQLDAQQKDKVVKWQLPVEIDGASGEYYVQFPDDLMEAADIKENDTVEWVDKGDGSYLLRKVSKTLGMDEC